MRVSLNLMDTRSRQQGQEASKSTKVVKISFKVYMKLMKPKFPLKYLLLDDRTVRFWGPTTAEKSSCLLCSTSQQSHSCIGSAHGCLALTCGQRGQPQDWHCRMHHSQNLQGTPGTWLQSSSILYLISGVDIYKEQTEGHSAPALQRDRTGGIPSVCGHLVTLPSALHCVSLGRGHCWRQASQGLRQKNRLRLCLL